MLAVLDRRRAKLNGLFPVKIEVVCRRRQKYYPAGLDLSPEAWAVLQDSKRKSDGRTLLEKAFFKVVYETDSLIAGGRFSFAALDARMCVFGRCPTLNGMLGRMAADCMKEGRTNSSFRFRSALRAVERYAGPSVPLSEVSPEWLRSCEKFWLHGGLKPSTAGAYMKNIKTAMNLAVTAGHISAASFPFGPGAYRIPTCTSRKLALSAGQIRRIMDYRGPSELEECRDLWLFSYLCNGINFRDMIYLKYRNIVGDEIWFVRAKTRNSSGSRVVRAAITGRMREIIGRIGNPCDGNPDTCIFRCADSSTDDYHMTMHVRKVVARCNRAYRLIAAQLGIPRFVTYSARHSFASMLNWKGIELSYISECLGHSSLSVTENYLAGFSHEDRARNSALLTDL